MRALIVPDAISQTMKVCGLKGFKKTYAREALQRWTSTSGWPQFFEQITALSQNELDNFDYHALVLSPDIWNEVGAIAIDSEILRTFVQELVRLRHLRDPAFSVERLLYVERTLDDRITSGLRSASLGQEQVMAIPILGEIALRQQDELADHVEIDNCRTLIERFKLLEARDRLTLLRKRLVGEEKSPYLRFRIATNLGVCELNLGNHVEAEREFEKALEAFPAHYLSWANMANVQLFLGNDNESLRFSIKAHGMAPSVSVVTAIHILSLGLNGRASEVEKLVTDNQWVLSDPLCLLSLGQIRMAEKDYADAANYFKMATEVDRHDPQAWILQAQAMFLGHREVLFSDTPLDGLLSKQMQEDFAKAEEMLSSALTLTESHDHHQMKIKGLLVRSALRAADKRFPESEEDTNEILSMDNANPQALFNKAQVCWLQKKLEEANQALDMLPPNLQLKCTTLRARIHLSQERFDSATELFETALADPEQSSMRMASADGLLESLLRSGNSPKLVSVVDELKQSSDAELLYALSFHFQRCQNRDEYLDTLRRAASFSVGTNLEKWIYRDLARAYSDCASEKANYDVPRAVTYFRMARDTYERLNPSPDMPEYHEWIIAEANSGMRAAAAVRARGLRDHGEAIPVVTEIEAEYYESVHEWERAHDALHALAKANPADVSLQRRLQFACRKCDHR